MAEDHKITLEALAKAKEGERRTESSERAEAELTETGTKALTPEMRAQVDTIKNDINLLDSTQLLTYGTGCQRQMTSFADNILQTVRSKDAGYVGENLSDLMVAVKSLEVDKISDNKGFLEKLGIGNSLRKFMARYETVETQIDKIEVELDKARTMLLKDIATFDHMYEKNLEYFHALEAHIIAGEEKLREAREEILPELRKEAEMSDTEMASQLVRDFEDSLNRFEQKVHDLKLSKTIALQSAPQIRLIQNNDKMLVDKIQTAVLNTIPLWKNQIVIALGLQSQNKVLEMQRKISDTTNDLLKKNAELLKNNTVGVAEESQRGIVDIETLKQVNQDLIETIDETMRINSEGRKARQEAELELVQIEGELKDTLLKNIKGK
jgi:uncharacterized protein YaaN involved in tellurite resistance